MNLRTDTCFAGGSSRMIDDPLEADRIEDPIVVTTRRALSRVAIVAAETASRFEREGVEHDPVAWMFAPRRLFRGEAAIDACLERDAFNRAIMLHGLSEGFDADPEAFDRLLDDDDDDLEDAFWSSDRMNSCCGTEMRLFSVTIDQQHAGKVRHGFHASTAPSMTEFRARVAGIFGSEALHHAVMREGINGSVRMVEGLVAPELMETLVSTPSYSGRRVAVTAERVVELDS